MICKKCEAEFKPPKGLSISKCPFCGEPVIGNSNADNVAPAHEMLLNIVKQFGRDILGEARLKGMIADLMPTAEKKHLRIFRQSVEDRIGAKLLELSFEDKTSRILHINSLKENFKNINGFNNSSDYVVDCYLYALGWLHGEPRNDQNQVQINNLNVVKQSVYMAFSDGILTKEEAQSIFALAETLTIPETDVVALITDEIKNNQFNPYNDEELEKITKEIIISKNWRTKTPIKSEVHEYESVKIGDQIWMKRNLDVSHFQNGDTISEARNAVDWERAGKEEKPVWCYYNNDLDYGENYGKLYNWYAVNDPRGLAPENWHIPSDEEWTKLITYLGGIEVAGGKMKTPGIKPWEYPNQDATNSSGFTGLPGGVCLSKGGFYRHGSTGNWWSTSSHAPSGNVTAISVSLYNTVNSIAKIPAYKEYGLNVRCVKNGANYFDSVRIGDQIWMKRNLDISHFRNGDQIPEAKTDEEWEKAGEEGKPAWCFYNNDPEIGKVYGKLYNWHTVNDPRGLAPEGWHVPSDEEWIMLEKIVDRPAQEVSHTIRMLFHFNFSDAGMRGYDVGKKLKAKTGWDDDGNGYNQFNFTALPGGERSFRDSFKGLGEYGEWWSSSQDTDVHAWHRLIYSDKNSIGRYSYFKSNGHSVRCVKND